MQKLKSILQSNKFYIGLFFIIGIYVLICIKRTNCISIYPENTTQITGKISSFLIDGDKLTLLLKAEEKIKATYLIKTEAEKEMLQNNLKIGVTLTLQGIKAEITPMTIPNTFDYQAYLIHEKIFFSFSATKLKLEENPVSFLDQIQNIFEKRLRKIGNHAYLRAFILGDKTQIEASDYQNIVDNGISHLFALSGMHLSLIYLLLEKILKKVKGRKGIIYSILILYLIITGMSVSFLRAILFMFLLDMNRYFKLNISKIKILFLIAFLLLLKNPLYLYNIGFWYTFTVTFSLIYCSESINKQSKIVTTILVSLITFSFSIPITIYINYEINLFSIINNILFVPLISTIIFPLALITFICPFILPLFSFSISLLNALNNFTNTFAINIIFGKINFIFLFLYYGLLLLFFKKHQKRYLCCLICLGISIYNFNLFDKNYHVYFLDVGQGDATLLVSPQNKEVILIDTGGKVGYQKESWQTRNKEFDLSKNMILFFKSLRIRKIDHLIITHGDQDHLGYTFNLDKGIKIKSVLLNQGHLNASEQNIKEKMNVVSFYKYKHFQVDSLSKEIYDNENDNSLVLKFKMKNTTILFMGDASKEVEKNLLKKNIKANIIKLGHHGSKTSSGEEFLKKVNPNLAIISAGRNNRYHHPSKETLETLKKLKIPFENTQDAGTIHIEINSKNIHINKIIS